MKYLLTAIFIVLLTPMLSACGGGTEETPEKTYAISEAGSWTDGTYTASAHGCLSDVAVTVTITGGKVTDVDIDASGETPELGGNAAAALAEQLTEAGTTTGVDAVAGATMTSDAVFTAMDDCLSQAQ